MSQKISIDPITRLEGHGKIEIFLNDAGETDRVFLQIPELRGFEKFCEGRPAEEMPQITSRICGVCPSAHHIASVKALDALYQVVPTPASRKIRELFYSMHFFEDHLLHFFILAGPDFIVGPNAAKEMRNILGVIGVVGVETGKEVIRIRKKTRDLMAEIGGKAVHPVLGLPGGVAKAITADTQSILKQFADEAVAFAQFTLKVFNEMVIQKKEYLDLILSDIYYQESYYMGMVDEKNCVNFYDGEIRVVSPQGKEVLKFKPADYHQVIGEHVEPWSYIKYPYLKNIGWKGFKDGAESGIYRVAPLARLNAADRMATPLAQEEYEKMYKALGGKPVHNTMGIHWARLVEVLYAAERIKELANDPDIISSDIRNMDLKTPQEGVGVVEAPRGTLFHHYATDDRGLIKSCNLVVASLSNSAAMCMAVERAAKKLIKNGTVNEGLLNMVEMAFRAYDPCFGCATHSLPGKMPINITVKNAAGIKLGNLVRNSDGNEHYIINQFDI